MGSTFRYVNKEWTVEAVEGGFLLWHTSRPPPGAWGRFVRWCKGAKPHDGADRVLLVKPGEVWECSRDSEAKPLQLMDCADVHARILNA